MTLQPVPQLHSIKSIDAAIEQHLAKERKRKVTTVLVTLASLWYILLLAKPMMAERYDVILGFVLAAWIAIPAWLWRKPAKRIQVAFEVRLPASDLFDLLNEQFELAKGEHTYNVLITRVPDFISCQFRRAITPLCRGDMLIDLSEGEEFTLMKWSLRFDNRMTSDDAHFVEHRLRLWFGNVLYGWID
jgi:hypothetical protein